jgi:Mtf2 family
MARNYARRSSKPTKPVDATAQQYSFGKPIADSGLSPTSSATLTHRERAIFQTLFHSLGDGNYGEKAGPARKPTEWNIDEVNLKRFPPALRAMAAHASERLQYKIYVDNVDGKTKRAAGTDEPEQDTAMRKAQDEHYNRVAQMMKDADSDLGLWMVLDRELFQHIAKLVLLLQSKGKRKPADAKRPETDEPGPNMGDLSVVGSNYPALLLEAAQQLKTRFPTSLLVFSILPEVKRLGHASFALGASVDLFNELMLASWRAFKDPNLVEGYLRDLASAGLMYERSTMQIIQKTRKSWKSVHRHRSPLVRAVNDNDYMQGKWQKLGELLEHVYAQRTNDALRAAKQQAIHRMLAIDT